MKLLRFSPNESLEANSRPALTLDAGATSDASLPIQLACRAAVAQLGVKPRLILSTMDSTAIVFLVVAEIIGVGLAIRLWAQVPKLPFMSRVLWSVLLMVPVLGIVFYFFVQLDPDPHGEDSTNGTSGWGTE